MSDFTLGPEAEAFTLGADAEKLTGREYTDQELLSFVGPNYNKNVFKSFSPQTKARWLELQKAKVLEDKRMADIRRESPYASRLAPETARAIAAGESTIMPAVRDLWSAPGRALAEYGGGQAMGDDIGETRSPDLNWAQNVGLDMLRAPETIPMLATGGPLASSLSKLGRLAIPAAGAIEGAAGYAFGQAGKDDFSAAGMGGAAAGGALFPIGAKLAGKGAAFLRDVSKSVIQKMPGVDPATIKRYVESTPEMRSVIRESVDPATLAKIHLEIDAAVKRLEQDIVKPIQAYMKSGLKEIESVGPDTKTGIREFIDNTITNSELKEIPADMLDAEGTRVFKMLSDKLEGVSTGPELLKLREIAKANLMGSKGVNNVKLGGLLKTIDRSIDDLLDSQGIQRPITPARERVVMGTPAQTRARLTEIGKSMGDSPAGRREKMGPLFEDVLSDPGMLQPVWGVSPSAGARLWRAQQATQLGIPTGGVLPWRPQLYTAGYDLLKGAGVPGTIGAIGQYGGPLLPGLMMGLGSQAGRSYEGF